MNICFKNLFSLTMGTEIEPYPYQESLANESWPDIVNVQTGMGKTAGIILSWLYKRLRNDPETPRRLIYCLPMRVLVEQTASNARKWVEKLTAAGAFQESIQPIVYVMMGGEIDKDWDMNPEMDAILIGTQDQLLSRALNRGYAMSRFRWPIQFGLLNNDCLWVMDEVQLMGSGLATTTQLQAFRKTLGTALTVRSVWMSATLQKDWLNTVDFDAETEILRECTLSDKDRSIPSLKRRFEATKPLEKTESPAKDVNKIAQLILDKHRPGTRTLVVVNTVKRAMDIYAEVKGKKPKASLALVHSHFRPKDRQNALDKLLTSPNSEGTICISTQVVEAGVDVSVTTLITDLAPWASLVQRFGRCNRNGWDDNARVIWLDLDLSEKGAAAPYTEEELGRSASILSELHDVGPKSLPPFTDRVDHKHVLRSKDFIDLFDTTPDLAGADIDISRFIRETDVHDVQVFWRDFPGERPGDDEKAPARDEICSVSASELKKMDNWRFDHLEKQWVKPEIISPGMVLMLRKSDGGYNSEKGWTGNKKDIPELLEAGRLAGEAYDDDYHSAGTWQTMADHSDAVVKEMEMLLSRLSLPDEDWVSTLLLAARWHDAGKTHDICQKAFLGEQPEKDNSIVWAKTNLQGFRYERKGFRHELASALAMLENGLPDLAAYLAAAHHGKVRLSIRSLPSETKPEAPDRRFARGIWDGEILREADLGGGQRLPETILDLTYMECGEGPRGPSWLARMLSLRDDPSLGPLRLALLEALLRIADWRASRDARENHA